eukprot:3328203-Pyramimonas_sp.AAC.1
MCALVWLFRSFVSPAPSESFHATRSTMPRGVVGLAIIAPRSLVPFMYIASLLRARGARGQ